MKTSFVLVLALAFGLVVPSARAGNTPTLSNLTQADADSVAKNFGNAIIFRSVEPPSSNGKIWGLGIGVGVDSTGASDINRILIAHGASGNVGSLPAGDIILTLQAPLGISGELGFLPRVSVGGFSARRSAFNLKWTFTDILLRDNTPFDAALRLGFGQNVFQYGQTTSGYSDTVKFDSKSFRMELAMSRKFLVFEPYLGLGLLHTSSTLSNTASVTLFNFTSSNSYDYAKSSFLFNLGAEIRLLILTLGVQAEWAFSETTGSVKLGLKF